MTSKTSLLAKGKVSAKGVSLSLAVATGCLIQAPAQALQWDLDNGASLRIDNKVSVGAAWRVEERDPDLVGLQNGGNAFSVNTDDGNLNFDKGDLTSLAAKILTDWSYTTKKFSAVARTRAIYDYVYNDDDPKQDGRPALPEKTQDQLGLDIEVLDAYLSSDFQLGNYDTTIKLGKRVLNWGEATFIPGGINFDALDVAKLRTPGAELREAFLPSTMVNAYIDLNDSLSLESFYQYGHQETRPDPRGSYFSTNDSVSPGADYVMLRFGQVPELDPNFTVARGNDADPDDHGQGGVAFRYYTDRFNGLELGLYAVNYHSRLPLISAVSATSLPTTGSYFVEYPEDIRLYGLSFNTNIGDWAVSGEYAFREDMPLQIDNIELLYAALGAPDQLDPVGPGSYIQGYRRFNVSQATIAGIRSYGQAFPWANDWIVIAEAGINHVHHMPSEDELRLEGPGTSLKGGTDTLGASPAQQQGGYPTASSWGFRLISRLSFLSVFNGINMYPRLVLFKDVNGTTPGPGGAFVEGRTSGALGLTTELFDNFEFDVNYARFWGGGNFNQVHDRDFVSATFKYSF